MQFGWILLIALHAMAAVFWAGSTFMLARTGGANADAMFRPQMGAATVAVLTGLGLGAWVHAGLLGWPRTVLMLGALAAIAAAGAQGALRKRPALAHRVAAPLLGIALVCMVIARYVG
ncbi:hypothetical protein PI87_20115 [Ralstonia sp. A12]|uniref:hypothetical protein n=1 Tax=Ralstonia sp. A12 TaxID=1217052 RepID=UPI0005756555|nr:hypothetical protein [Ralstonia sp. A12]KHK51862.1 hypothetical protein PI87_20115 [Ralstonia sp. A12]